MLEGYREGDKKFWKGAERGEFTLFYNSET